MNETGELPSPTIFYAVASHSDGVTLRIAFGPVNLEELAQRALDVLCRRDHTFKVHRREVRPSPAHYVDGLSRERALLDLAEADPVRFGTIVSCGNVDPIVVRFPVADSTSTSQAVDA